MKNKMQYQVIRIDTLDYGDGHTDTRETEVGTTYAVSEAQAINNIKFRLGIKPGDLIVPWWGDGGRRTSFRATEI